MNAGFNKKLIIITGLILFAVFGFAQKSLAYETSGSFTSTNLLSGQFVVSIDSFVYNLSSKPASTSASVQFSQNGTNWYSSADIENASDTLTTGANNTIDLSGLSWTGGNFYYKVTLAGDGSDTPTLDDITLNYTDTVGANITVTATVQEYLLFTSSATSTTLSPDLIDSNGNTNIASSSNITLTLNTSSADGYSVTVNGAGNGLASSTNYIYTSEATTTVVAGTDAFGLQATTTTSDLTINSSFVWPFTGNIIGSASSSVATQLVSKTSPGSNQTFIIRFLAASDAAQPAGSYQETITLTAVPVP